MDEWEGGVKMKSCGIITEYNPFHNGHRYQLKEAKKLSQSEVMIIAMSGNFLQRGEPALIDKWERARIALQNGADLVVEMSVLGSSQSTDLFAKNSVRLLQSLDCDSFSFGVEQGKSADFVEMAQFTMDKEKEIDLLFQSFRNDGRSYPAQMEEAIRKTAEENGPKLAFGSPNNLLGLAYVKENLRYQHPMETIVIQRTGAQHYDIESKSNSIYASGTMIRNAVLEKEGFSDLKWTNWAPTETVKAINKNHLISWENYWPYLRYQLVSSTPEYLSGFYQVEEGIEHRLKKFSVESKTFSQFISLVKNKRWTWARLQRVCLYILLEIEKKDVDGFFDSPPVTRILGFTKAGSKYLNELKKKTNTVMITNVSKKNKEHLLMELKSDQIYQIGVGLQLKEQNYTRAPIQI